MIIDKEPTSNIQTTFTSSENEEQPHTQISVHTALYNATPISTAKQRTEATSRESQATNEVAEESTVVMATDDAMKSTPVSKPSEGRIPKLVQNGQMV